MALLSIVSPSARPGWRDFFTGRRFQEEGQRLLALTRYGQSRAARKDYEILWMIPQTKLRPGGCQDGFTSGATTGTRKDVSYKLGDGLRFQFEKGVPAAKAGGQHPVLRPMAPLKEGSLHRW